MALLGSKSETHPRKKRMVSRPPARKEEKIVSRFWILRKPELEMSFAKDLGVNLALPS